jgi:hypothetical protein
VDHAHESNAHKSNSDHDLSPTGASRYNSKLNGMIHYLRGFSFIFRPFLLPILVRLVPTRMDHVDDPLPVRSRLWAQRTNFVVKRWWSEGQSVAAVR